MGLIVINSLKTSKVQFHFAELKILERGVKTMKAACQAEIFNAQYKNPNPINHKNQQT